MPPKRKGKKRPATKTEAATAEKKTKQKEAKIEQEEITEKQEDLDKTEPKTIEEDENAFTLVKSWTYQKPEYVTDSCFTSQNKVVILGSDDRKSSNLYFFNKSGHLLQEVKLDKVSGGNSATNVTEIYDKSDQTPRLAVSYTSYNVVERRHLETGELVKSTEYQAKTHPRIITQTPDNNILMTRKEIMKDSNEIMIFDPTSTNMLRPISTITAKTKCISDVCCLKDPEHEDAQHHLLVISDTRRSEVICTNEDATAIYWKINKLPQEGSSFGTSWKPGKICALQNNDIAIIHNEEKIFVFDCYGNFKSCSGANPASFGGRISSIDGFTNDEGVQCLAVVYDNGRLTAGGMVLFHELG